MNPTPIFIVPPLPTAATRPSPPNVPIEEGLAVAAPLEPEHYREFLNDPRGLSDKREPLAKASTLNLLHDFGQFLLPPLIVS